MRLLALLLIGLTGCVSVGPRAVQTLPAECQDVRYEGTDICVLECLHDISVGRGVSTQIVACEDGVEYELRQLIPTSL